jgi:RsmE family RNA methyltransferase
MNLLLLQPEDLLEGDRARISGRQLNHVRRVLGKDVGDTLAAGCLGGGVGTATIVAMSDAHAELSCRFDELPPAASRTHLVLALPRPPMLRRVLQHATTMGCKDIALVGANRVEKSFWDSHSLREAAVSEQLQLGLEQAGDTIMPRVTLHRRFLPFVQDELPARLTGRTGVLAHPAAAPSPDPAAGLLTLAVGPEGGWVDFELQQLEAAGLQRWSMGPRPLRVETAVVAALSRLR